MNQPDKNAGIEEKLKYAKYYYVGKTVRCLITDCEGLVTSDVYASDNCVYAVAEIIPSRYVCLFEDKKWAEVVSKPQQLSEEQIRQDERTKVLNEVIERINGFFLKDNYQIEYNILLIKSIQSMLPQPEPDKFEAEAERMIKELGSDTQFIDFQKLIVEALKKDPKEV
jgi:hypothetical protein